MKPLLLKARISRWIVLVTVIGCLSAPGDESPFLPVLAIEELTLNDPDAYAQLAAQANAAMKRDYAVPLFLRAYIEVSTTGYKGSAFSLSPADSFVTLLKNLDTFSANSDLISLRNSMNALTSAGPTTYLKAIRFDGTNTPGWLYNTLVSTNDEAALLVRVSRMEAVCHLQGVEEMMVNVFRAISGPAEFTHLVSVNRDSSESVAAVLDVLSAEAFTLAFSEGDNAFGKIITSAVYREIKTQNP